MAFVHNEQADLHAFEEKLIALPIGYFETWYEGRRYAVTKSVFNNGASIKLEAHELGGTNHISLNAYMLSRGRFVLKPCEMSDKKVIGFVNGIAETETEKKKPEND